MQRCHIRTIFFNDTFCTTFQYSLHHHHNVVYFDGGQGAVITVRHNQEMNEVRRKDAKRM